MREIFKNFSKSTYRACHRGAGITSILCPFLSSSLPRASHTLFLKRPATSQVPRSWKPTVSQEMMLNLGVINAHTQWNQTSPKCSLCHWRAPTWFGESRKFLPASSSAHSYPPSQRGGPCLTLAKPSQHFRTPHPTSFLRLCLCPPASGNLMSLCFGKGPRAACGFSDGFLG